MVRDLSASELVKAVQCVKSMRECEREGRLLSILMPSGKTLGDSTRAEIAAASELMFVAEHWLKQIDEALTGGEAAWCLNRLEHSIAKEASA